MGQAATDEALAARWAEVVGDPTLRDLPYKIELNAWGKIEMSPASNRHGRLQARTASELNRQMPDGEAITEASILTDIGVRVPDVVLERGSLRYFGPAGELESTRFPVRLELPGPLPSK